jgi:hypothetical protein
MFETMRENVATRIETKSQPLEAFHGLLPMLASTLDAAEVFQHLAARILPHDEANLALLTEDGTQFQEYRRTRTSGTPCATDWPLRNLVAPQLENRQTDMRELFSAVAESEEVHLSLAYRQGGVLMWVTADKPNLPLYAARDPSIVRAYQEDQVINIVRSGPMNVDTVTEITLRVKGELTDVFDGTERVVAVVIQRPYTRQVYGP